MLGIEDGDLGTHSCRNVVAAMVDVSYIVSPPIVSIWIRDNSVMGEVKYRYLKRESTVNQYIGRCTTVMDQLNNLFAIYPPYIGVTSIEEEIGQAHFRKSI